MSTLREIKSHIASVSSIAQVTRALELVSTTKHHRLQVRVDSTRAFAEKSWDVLNRPDLSGRGYGARQPALLRALSGQAHRHAAHHQRPRHGGRLP